MPYHVEVITPSPISRRPPWALLIAAAMVCACDSAPNSSAGVLVGMVTTRERLALPLNAVVELRLEDLTRTDLPATVLATHALVAEGPVPVRFEMHYPQRLIVPQRRYGLSASIRSPDGKLLFRTPDSKPVFRDGPAGEFVELVLLPPAARIAEPQGVPIGTWRLVSMRREDESLDSMGAEPAYTIEFGAGGAIHGKAHCVDFTARYTDGDWGHLSISRLVAAKTRCPPPSRADEFIRSIDLIRHHEMRADQLVLMYGVGGELIFNRS